MPGRAAYRPSRFAVAAIVMFMPPPLPRDPVTLEEAVKSIACLRKMILEGADETRRSLSREQGAHRDRDAAARALASARHALAEVLDRFAPCGEGWSVTMMTPDAELARWREEGGL